ncbi:MAG: undecaprenyl/decaprenyl-phosphate alpha-N-acetylglucosaminyl 1-phosphate transferase, partial [Planctomycetes bacterium]|nr:undecaprenyl/decaprenyl-phosphate alpha-N-acetylglucosaminyl 1-phosphate transferase [Planctomycetota bacterium]
MIPLAAAVFAACATFAATPLVRRLALRAGVLDPPGGRKWHDAPVPRLGGLALLAGIALTLLLVSGVASAGESPSSSETSLVVLLLAGVAALGALDDLRGLRPAEKLGIEALLALAACACGYEVRSVDLPGIGALALGPLSLPVTVLWFLGITNALNLIDGMDGLASGAAAISAAACAVVASRVGAGEAALLFATVAGAAVGFLPHNRPPARMFLGDSGSLLLGFSLALFSVRGACKGAVAISLLAPAVALGLPIADAALAFSRRLRGKGGDRSGLGLLRGVAAVGVPDADHIHHRLARAGLTRRETVGTLHAVCLALGLAAFAATIRRDAGSAAILVYAAAASVFGIRVLARAGASSERALRGDPRRERALLVVHPDGEVSAAVRREAEALGLRAVETADAEEGARLARERSFDL